MDNNRKPDLLPEILLLKQEECIKAGLLDMDLILRETENTFRMLGEGKVVQPAKIFLPVPDFDHWTSYGMSMPSYIGGENEVIGFKWAAEAVDNVKMYKVPYGLDVVLLSDPKTMMPKAILDGTITTAMRTSAAAGVCAKYTARKDSKIAALIGAGVIGRTMIMAIAASVPSLEEIRIVDLDLAKAEALAAEFAEGGLYSVKPAVVPMSDVKAAVNEADLIVTETTARATFIRKDWLKPNCTAIQMESCSFDDDILLAADHVVLDSFEQILHLNSPVRRLNEKGLFHEGDGVEIKDVVTGKAPGRTSDDQFVFVETMGMGCVDIAIANMLYLRATEMGIGTKWTMWDDPLWV
ncbi:MAG: ornithine cyclodeaminase family protein [Mogibacterium sp.]|nr:ornithine cyclodeaminase family protein [Mogibacterium sp.]